MAAASNISIKKADGTTVIVYSLLSASGGDRSPAVWRSTTAVGTAGQQPFCQMSSRSSGDGNVRRVDVLFVYPSVYTDTSGNTQVRSKAVFQGSWALPLDATSADLAEMGAQMPFMMSSAQWMTAFQTGYAPT